MFSCVCDAFGPLADYERFFEQLSVCETFPMFIFTHLFVAQLVAPYVWFQPSYSKDDAAAYLSNPDRVRVMNIAH
jgi:hypothetical protein